MDSNALPQSDNSVNTTGCCPRFNPAGWDAQVLHFKDKPFVHAETRSLAHVPLNMGHVFSRVSTHMTDAAAVGPAQYIVLSRDTSAFASEHLFAATRPVAGEEMTTLSGDFVTKVFEGPYSHTREWYADMEKAVRDRGKSPGDIWFYYTTCPKCAKAYGQNYIVGVARI